MPSLRTNRNRMSRGLVALKHHLGRRWRESLLLALSTAMFVLSVLLMPVLFERQGEEWFRFSRRLDDAARPLEVHERFYQFNVDAPHWIGIVSDFPYVYVRDQLRINRPVYPALSSLLARALSLFVRWPDWRGALLEPTDWDLTFASMLTVNYLTVVASVQVFFAWLKRHLAVSTSLIGATLLALAPWWLWQANQAATSVVAVGIIVLVLYLFDNLLGERRPSRAQIAGYALVMGILMLAKAQYDVLFAGWLWAACQRRWRVLGGTFALHWLPLLAWIGVLQLVGLPYYNHEVSAYGQGVWFLSMMAQGAWRDLYSGVANLGGGVLSNFWQAFSPFIIALSIWTLLRKELVSATIRQLAMAGLVAVAGFLIAIQRSPRSMTFDAFFVIYPLAAIGLSNVVERWIIPRMPGGRAATMAFSGAVLLFFVLNVPISWYLSVPPIFAWRPALGELLVLLSRLSALRTG